MKDEEAGVTLLGFKVLCLYYLRRMIVPYQEGAESIVPAPGRGALEWQDYTPLAARPPVASLSSLLTFVDSHCNGFTHSGPLGISDGSACNPRTLFLLLVPKAYLFAISSDQQMAQLLHC